MGQKNQTQNQSAAPNPSFANYPKEAYEPEQTASIQGFSRPSDDGLSNMLPLLMQLMGGKGDMSLFDGLMKGGKLDPSTLFKASAKSTKKEGVAPRDDLIL